MYEVDDDTYCYPGTTVLRNLLDLTTQAELDAFEAEITLQRSTEPLPAGKLDDKTIAQSIGIFSKMSTNGQVSLGVFVSRRAEILSAIPNILNCS